MVVYQVATRTSCEDEQLIAHTKELLDELGGPGDSQHSTCRRHIINNLNTWMCV